MTRLEIFGENLYFPYRQTLYIYNTASKIAHVKRVDMFEEYCSAYRQYGEKLYNYNHYSNELVCFTDLKKDQINRFYLGSKYEVRLASSLCVYNESAIFIIGGQTLGQIFGRASHHVDVFLKCKKVVNSRKGDKFIDRQLRTNVT